MDMPMLLAAAERFARPYYAEPQRAYHTLGHVQAMLAALEQQRVLTPALALAVWGHDLIYDPRRPDNEERSAEVFGRWLSEQAAPPELVHEVGRLILETRHAQPPSDRTAALLIDADLGVFGGDDEGFWAYERAIRHEYQFVPWPSYREGRRAVLHSFLARETVYTTPEFAGGEPGARLHLQAACSVLETSSTEQAAERLWAAPD